MKKNLLLKKSSFFRAVALCLAMSCSTLAAWANPAVGDVIEYNGVQYKVTSFECQAMGNFAMIDGAVVVNAQTLTGDVTIPDEISTPVTVSGVTIDAYLPVTAFDLSLMTIGDDLTSLTVNNSGEKAYSVTIPDGCFKRKYNLTSVSFSGEVSLIGDGAFNSCKKLTSVSFGNVKSLDEHAFQACFKLTSVSWGNSEFTTLPTSVLKQTSITSIIIPASVTEIQIGAFGNTKLKTVTVKSTTPPICDSNAFSDIDLSSCTLIVPEQSKSLYETAAVWKDFGKLETGLGSVTADEAGRANGKYIEGGRLVIVKGGVKYNMLGQEIK